eukprot:2992977-Rhodomonas_salina.1
MSEADRDGLAGLACGIPFSAQAAVQRWPSTSLCPKLRGDGGAEQRRDFRTWLDEDAEPVNLGPLE